VILAKAGILNQEKSKFLDIENMDGQIELASDMKIGYLSQDLFWSDTANTLREEIQTILPSIVVKIERYEEIKNNPNLWEESQKLNKELLEMDGFKKYTLLQEIHRYFGISDEHLDYNVLKLSGGEQTKIQIAKFLMGEVDILILDEPTNHLDMESIESLNLAMDLYDGTVVFVSHDREFVSSLANRVVEFGEDNYTDYRGNYEDYLESQGIV